MKPYNFDQLFILDLANNHQGDMTHARRVIKETAKVIRDKGVRAALKFQFRNLETFVHKDHQQGSANKHIPRFLGTRLQWGQYAELLDLVREEKLISMCTPFDEASLAKIKELDIEIIKIASCSAADRPLLNEVSKAGKPVVASTAGLTVSQIDYLVNLFEERRVDFALMHCVAIYPTPGEKLNLNQIKLLKDRFPNVPIGFSTHEDQDATWPIQMSYGMGAQLFERHIGIDTPEYKLNAYSSQPHQLEKWIDAYKEAYGACGGDMRGPATDAESNSLKSLMRGVYAKEALQEGDKLSRDRVYFAMPYNEGQMSANDWHGDLTVNQSYAEDDIIQGTAGDKRTNAKDIIAQILLQVKGMLNNAKIFIGRDSSIEISHHYGIDRFREFGAVIIDCVNRAYCKKLIVVLPRQKHPYHFHKIKEETFQLLHGDLEVEIEGKRHQMEPGDTLLVEPEQWHKFHTLDGAIFEEISTTHLNNDSFYEDDKISQLPRETRKTSLPNWEALVT